MSPPIFLLPSQQIKLRSYFKTLFKNKLKSLKNLQVYSNQNRWNLTVVFLQVNQLIKSIKLKGFLMLISLLLLDFLAVNQLKKKV